MKRLAGVVLLVIFAASGARSYAQGQVTRQATVELKNASGASVGTIMLMQEGDAVHLKGTLNNLPPGVHGIHIHAVGSCSPDFAAAGPHFNPMNKKHGLENPDGPHAGDLSNLTVNADGTGTYDYKDTMVSLLGGVPNSLYDADGSSLVIHASADDYKTDPAGNSGARIACGVIPNAIAISAPQTAPAPSTLPNTGNTSYVWLLLLGALATLAAGSSLLRRERTAR